jgi:hypothetical protein
MTEVRGQMTDDRGQMTDDRGQMTEDRGQMTEDRGQMTEDRSQMTDVRCQRLLNAEVGMVKQRAESMEYTDDGGQKSDDFECGSRNGECGNLMWKSECGGRNLWPVKLATDAHRRTRTIFYQRPFCLC